MKKKINTKLLSLSSIGFLLALFLLTTSQAKAGLDDNIRGRAYIPNSDEFIYFNCIDEKTGVFPFTFPFNFSVDPCSLFEEGIVGADGYGVSLDDNNVLRGQARIASGATGLISFQDGIPAGESLNHLYTNCDGVDASNCNAGNGCSACYNTINDQVYGWAKVIDDASFIKLDADLNPTIIQNYLSSEPGYFKHYAQHDSWGPISFNCDDENKCPSKDDYKVYIWDLKVRQLSSPNWSFNDACSGAGAKRAVLAWQLTSGNQTGFEIKMSAAEDLNSAPSSGKITSLANQLVCPSANCPLSLDYKTSYYWWLKLYDDTIPTSTDWVQFDHSGSLGELTDNITFNQANNPGAYQRTFTTYKHEFPYPYFNLPPTIIAGTSTEFAVDASSGYYREENPSSFIPYYNDEGGTSLEWSSNSGAIIDPTNTATTSIIFTNIGTQSISLKMTDPSFYSCSYSQTIITINYNLPLWQEVKPR